MPPAVIATVKDKHYQNNSMKQGETLQESQDKDKSKEGDNDNPNKEDRTHPAAYSTIKRRQSNVEGASGKYTGY